MGMGMGVEDTQYMHVLVQSKVQLDKCSKQSLLMLLRQFVCLFLTHFSAFVCLSIFSELRVENLISSIHIFASEGWSNAAAIVHGNVAVVIPPTEITGHPVTPLSS
jgi:hypothetical protein